MSDREQIKQWLAENGDDLDDVLVRCGENAGLREALAAECAERGVAFPSGSDSLERIVPRF